MIVNPHMIQSFLMLPAIKEQFLLKLLTLKGKNKPDAVIFDLEDSISPNHKGEARETLKKYLIDDKSFRDTIFSNYVVWIRVNRFDTPYYKEDLKLVSKIKPHFILLAKVETTKEIDMIRAAIKGVQLCTPIETIKGYENREQILKHLNWFDCFCIGYEDLSSELLIERPDRLDQINPLSLIINNSLISARKYNRVIVDAVCRKFGTKKNLKNLEDECQLASNIGFSSKIAIHPSQIAIINKHFDKKNLLEKADKILKSFNKLNDGTSVVTTEDKQMLDTPSVRMYKRVKANLTRSF